MQNPDSLRFGGDAGWFLLSPTRFKIDLSGVWSYKAGKEEGTVKIPAAYDFTGEVTFERRFGIAPEHLDRYRFHVVSLGANYAASVWINNEFIANHVGGYTSFIAPIPDNIVQPGEENFIRVVTDNQLDPVKTLPLRQRVWGWKNYGGLYRHIYILGTPKIYITQVRVNTNLNADFSVARVSIQATVEGGERGDTLVKRLQAYAEVFDRATQTSVATTPRVALKSVDDVWQIPNAECQVPSPRIWSPDTPDMYSVRVYLVDPVTRSVVDEFRSHFGIRRIELKGGKVVLNGKPLTLLGVNWYEDHDEYGSALPYEQMERDIIMIKNLGANAVRFGFHPTHPFMLDLCDRYGLLALEEIPAREVPSEILAREHFIELATTRLREMIVRDRNHPSVLAWGLGDDLETSQEQARGYVEALVAAARSVDSRPVYYGTGLLEGDKCSDLVDFTALMLQRRDAKEVRKMLETLKASNPGRVLIIGKLGVEVQPGNDNGYTDPLSTQAQARFYLQLIDAVRKAGSDGVFVWSFNDWYGDRPALTVNSGNPWLHSHGLVTVRREKRLAYEAVRTAFQEGRFSALPPGHAAASSAVVFVAVGVVLLVGMAYMYNANRRFRGSLNRSMLNSYNFFSDLRDQRIVTIWHSTLMGLGVSAGVALVLSSFLYRFRHNRTLDNVLSMLLVSDSIKEWAVRLILQPPMFILVFTGILFALLVAISMIVLLIKVPFKVRMFPFHTYAVTMWSTPPLLALIPVGMLVYRLLDDPLFVAPTLILLLVLTLWVFMRFLKGLSIVMEVFPPKVYAVGIVALVGIVTALFLYYDSTQSASMYFARVYHDLLGTVQ